MIAMALIMGMTIVGVMARLLGRPLSGFTNLSESLLVVAIYLSVAYTQQYKQHVSVEFLMDRLNEKARNMLNIVNLAIALTICSVILYTSWDYAIAAWKIRERMDGAPFYPIYPPKIAIAVGITFLWLQLLVDVLRGILKLFPPKEGENENGSSPAPAA